MIIAHNKLISIKCKKKDTLRQKFLIKNFVLEFRYADVAQVVEQLIRNQ